MRNKIIKVGIGIAGNLGHSIMICCPDHTIACKIYDLLYDEKEEAEIIALPPKTLQVAFEFVSTEDEIIELIFIRESLVNNEESYYRIPKKSSEEIKNLLRSDVIVRFADQYNPDILGILINMI